MSVLNKLGLSPFEWSMSDCVSASPMEFVVRLDCVGIVDVEKFTEAIETELKRQPLLQANATVGQTHRESSWRPAANCSPEIRWCEGNPDEGSGFPKDFVPIELETEIGFRFYGWRFRGNDQTHIIMKFVYHHACCDGKGGIEFAKNTFIRYQCLLDDKATPCGNLAVVDEQQIFSRNLPAANRLSLIDRIWSALVVRPKRVGNMLLSKPRVFSASAEIAKDGSNDIFAAPPRQCTTRFSVTETKQLGALANKLSTSSNTVLARELFHALNDYFKCDSRHINNDNKKSVASVDRHKKRGFRILIPYSLRDERHKEMPVANCVSMVYLEANEKLLKADSSDDPVLVSNLTSQVSFIRRWNLQYSWIESIDLYAKIWPIVRLLKFGRKGRSRNLAPNATTVMTNLGRVFSEGALVDSKGEFAVEGLVVKSVHVAAPCTAAVTINFSINFYGNRLNLDATYLPSRLDREAAKGMLDSWKRRILDSVSGSRIDPTDA